MAGERLQTAHCYLIEPSPSDFSPLQISLTQSSYTPVSPFPMVSYVSVLVSTWLHIFWDNKKGHHIKFSDKFFRTCDGTVLATNGFSGYLHIHSNPRESGAQASPAKNVPQDSRSCLVINTYTHARWLNKLAAQSQVKATWRFPTTDFLEPLC